MSLESSLIDTLERMYRGQLLRQIVNSREFKLARVEVEIAQDIASTSQPEDIVKSFMTSLLGHLLKTLSKALMGGTCRMRLIHFEPNGISYWVNILWRAFEYPRSVKYMVILMQYQRSD